MTTDTPRYIAALRQRLSENTRVDPASSITEKAERAAQNIWNRLDRTWSVEELTDIIAAEFQGSKSSNQEGK